MGDSKCEHPELKPKSGTCSDELIEKCHGKVKAHPCGNKEDENNNE